MDIKNSMTDKLSKRRKQRMPRFVMAYRMVMLALGVLLVRLAYMQLTRYGDYVSLLNENRVDAFAIPAARGTIYDRHHRPLAVDLPSFSLVYTQGAFADPSLWHRLSKGLGLPTSELMSHVNGKRSGSVHALIATHLSPLQLSYVREHQRELPGIRVIPDSVRQYPQGDVACHVLGYINSIPPAKEALYVKHLGFPATSKVGWSGVEASYDSTLRGTPGRICVEVNSAGIPVRVLPESRAAKRGADLTLSLDAAFQQEVQRALAQQVRWLQYHGHAGVTHAMAVAMDPDNGDVLAMASVPTFKPEWFVHGISYHTYQSEFAPAERNWALQAPIAPGSTMKPLTALFALSQGIVKPDTVFPCDGQLTLPQTNDTKIKCWTRHDEVSLRDALAQSCDVYFYRLSLLYGHWPPPKHSSVMTWLQRDRLQALHKLEALQKAFHLGTGTGIDLPNEETGYVNETSGQVTDLPYTAIGQNEVFTTLELAVYAAQLANGGHPVTPHVAAHARTSVPRQTRALVSARDLTPVRQGMYRACNDPHGTAWSTFHDGNALSYTVAGKTGTAETGIAGFDNAVFIGFAPYNHPKIAIAVVVPGGGHGTDSTGPVARRIFDQFFKLSAGK